MLTRRLRQFENLAPHHLQVFLVLPDTHRFRMFPVRPHSWGNRPLLSVTLRQLLWP